MVDSFKILFARVYNVEVIRYLMIGLLTALVDVATYQLLINLGVYYLLADLVNIPLILLVNYLGHKFYTFRTHQKYKVEVVKYLLNVLLQTAIALIVLYINVQILHLGQLGGKIVQLAVIAVLNYLSLKVLVFGKK